MSVASRWTVAILVFDEVEVLDVCGPFEVFSVAGNLSGCSAFSVLLVSENPGPIRARNGLRLLPDHTLADCPPTPILLVPGGQGTRREMHRPEIVQWVRQRALATELLLSVCTGALILGTAGLLDGLDSTTHHGSLDLLQQTAPRTTVRRDRRYVDNGKVITSGGIAAGIDMALHVVARLAGEDLARLTAQQMEYPYGE